MGYPISQVNVVVLKTITTSINLFVLICFILLHF